MSTMKSQRTKITSRKLPPPPPVKPKPKQKDPVEVYCRLRPVRDPEENVCAVPINNTVIQITPAEPVLRHGSVKETQYTFKFAFDEKTSQKALFDHVALPLVSDLLNGRNGLLFTYGVTGSGKTFTMTGVPQDGGILPRSLDVLFNSISELQAKKYIFKPDLMNGFDVQSEADAMLDRQKDLISLNQRCPKTPRRKDIPEVDDRLADTTKIKGIEEDNNYAVFVTYIEIYNNYVYDLLEDVQIDPVKPKPLQSKLLREDATHHMYIHGCTEIEVKSTNEAFDAFYKGQKRRRVAHTTLNTESSRSHSVFTIRLVQAPLDSLGEEVIQTKEAICISQLSLVDLAGSERTIRTKASGDRLREAGNINNSLMVLRTCIEALRENQMGANKMVPYRDSKLTHLFKNFFDGEGKVRMIVCVNPSVEDYEENLHVMRFAELTQEVMIPRPTAPQFDVGLTPGRRRVNFLYKEVIEKLNSMKVPAGLPATFSVENNVDSTALASFDGWATFPKLEFNLCNDDNITPTLVEFLELRKQQRQAKQNDLGKRQKEFRDQLLEMERKHVLLLHQVDDLKAQLDVRDQKLKATERKLNNVTQLNDVLQRKNNQYEKNRNNLEQELDEKDMLLNQGELEKVKLKARMHDKLHTERERMTREMAKRVREKETEFQAKMWERDAKLRTLRDIVNDKWTGPLPGGPEMPCGSQSAKKISRSDPKLNTDDKQLTRHRARRSVSPERITSVPVANPRHRRSRSASGDMWLEHNPPGNVELGTLLQPQIRKRKSVSKLTVKDMTKEASKYVIAHQQQDNNGEIETQYFKGSVIPSAGGGAQVIFNDVETLKQTSPGSRKRSADGQVMTDQHNSSGEWTDVQTRCAVGIEGHNAEAKKYCH